MFQCFAISCDDRNRASGGRCMTLALRYLKLGSWLAAVLWLAPVVSCSVSGSDASARPPRDTGVSHAQASAELAAQIEALMSRLRDASMDLASRREASGQLLALNHFRAHETLAAELRSNGDPAARLLIVQELAAYPGPVSPTLIPALSDMMAWVDGPQVETVAAALGRFRDKKVAQEMTLVALDPAASIGHRRGAVLTLGYYSQKKIAGLLMRLVQTRQPPAVRTAAFTSLARLSGVKKHGSDPELWDQWWQRHQSLSEDQWLEAIIKNMARGNAALTRQNQAVEKRLVDAQRQMFRAAGDPERPALVLAMLDDSLPAIRQLGIELSVQQLVDAQPIAPQVRKALRAHLDDPVASIRQSATQLLHDLADEPAADRVAQRLASSKERDPDVLRVSLNMMARLPRPAAIGPALGYLRVAGLSGPAAGVLASVADAGLLDEAQERRAIQRVRDRLDEGGHPEPRYVALLGKIGSEEDWLRIASWMQSHDDSVKQAAAQAWADSGRSLRRLARHAGDPVIQPILLEAARLRGKRRQTLLAIIDHKPEPLQAAQAWQRALVAMASRVPPATILEADRRLADLGGEIGELREQIISAAIDKLAPLAQETGTEPGDSGSGGQPVAGQGTDTVFSPKYALVDLYLLRAEVRISEGDPSQALADYQHVEQIGGDLNAQQQRLYDLGVLQARLAEGGCGPGDVVGRIGDRFGFGQCVPVDTDGQRDRAFHQGRAARH